MSRAQPVPEPDEAVEILADAKRTGEEVIKLDVQILQLSRRLKDLKENREALVDGLVKTVVEGKQEPIQFDIFKDT